MKQYIKNSCVGEYSLCSACGHVFLFKLLSKKTGLLIARSSRSGLAPHWEFKRDGAT